MPSTNKRILPLALVGLLLFALMTPALYAAIGDSLAGCWTLDEASAGVGAVTRNDSSANGNHLTDINTTASAAGKISNGADFESTNSEYLSHVSNATLQMGDIDFTICAWVKLESTGVNMMIVTKDDDAASSRDYTLSVTSDTKFSFYTNGGGGLSVVLAGPFSIATFYFVCGWHNAAADTINISVDNAAPISVATGGEVPQVSAAEFRIGAREYAAFENYFDGVIDEVAIWKRVPSGAEFTDLYNAGVGRACSYIVPAAGGGPPTGSLLLLGIGR